MAGIWCDIIFSVFLFTGIEHGSIESSTTRFMPFQFSDMPWSHSLAMTFIWAALWSILYYARHRYIPGSMMVGLGVLSHWFLDWASHRPDMTIMPNSMGRYGLGLWDHPSLIAVIEIGGFISCAWIYMKTFLHKQNPRRQFFIALIATLTAIYALSFFMPPPKNMQSVAISNLLLLPILIAWVRRIERE
jgi:hypothetical protein